MDPAEVDALKREYTQGLWWIDWARFWGHLGRAVLLRAQIEQNTAALNDIKRKFGVKGRPRGAPNKKPVEADVLVVPAP